MDDNVVIVGIDVEDVLRHVALLFVSLGILFAQVPVEREIVGVASDELAEVELAFHAQSAAIQGFWNYDGFLGRAARARRVDRRRCT